MSSSGGLRSPAVACWASDHGVASSNPLMGKFFVIFVKSVLILFIIPICTVGHASSTVLAC